MALPARVRHPDRKGKVESGVGHAQKTPLKGMRFESIEEAQAYLDRWEKRWADTRIHGTTKRQVAAMFAEERPALTPLPVEPFRYYAFGKRTVHLDGCIEVEAAYYAPPPGYIGRELHAQWDGRVVRIIDPKTGQLLREHLRRERGRRAILPEDRPSRTPPTTMELLARASRAGRQHRRRRRAHPRRPTASPACAASSASSRSPRSTAAPPWTTPAPRRSRWASPPTAS